MIAGEMEEQIVKQVDYASEGWYITYKSAKHGELRSAFAPTWARATRFVRDYADTYEDVTLRGGGQQVYVGTFSTRWTYKEQ